MKTPLDNDLNKVYESFNQKHDHLRHNLMNLLADRSKQHKQTRSVNPLRLFIADTIMRSRITKLGTAAVIIIGVLGFFLFFGNNKPTLYAEIVKGLESARTMHCVVRIYRDGKWETDYQIWFDDEKGVVETGYPANRYHQRIDDGVFLWRYTPGNDFVVRSKSIGATVHIRYLISGERPQNKVVRRPEGDRNVDGVQCRMYYYTNPENTEEVREWIEDAKGKKFLRFWESRRRAENGQWKPSKMGTIQYNMPISESHFSRNFGPNVRIIDADEIMSEQFGPDKAIFTRKTMGLIFAVHEVQRSEKGLIYISCTLRPTEETTKRFGALKLDDGHKTYGTMELFSISDGKICFPYKKCRLSWMRHNGIEAKWWILVPRENRPKGIQTLDLGVRVFTEDKLAKQRIEQGKPENREFKPMTTLPLPDRQLPVEEMISRAYSQAKVFDPIRRVYLYVPDDEFFFRVKLFQDVSETELTKSINWALEQLKNE